MNGLFDMLTLSSLITTLVVLNLFHYAIQSLLLRMKCVCKHQNLQMFAHKFNKIIFAIFNHLKLCLENSMT